MGAVVQHGRIPFTGDAMLMLAQYRAALTEKRRALLSSKEDERNRPYHLHAPWRVTHSTKPSYDLNNFSALPWAIRSLSAALTGSCSKKARASAID